MYSITDFLELEDPNAFISDVRIEGCQRFITVESHPSLFFCPKCSYRMHSRGIKTRKILHPIFQDYYQTYVILRQRHWHCSNADCRYETNECFRFVDKSRRITNTTDMLIIEVFLDLTASVTSIAQRFALSDTEVMRIFDYYVKMDRLPLTDIISIDEVHLDLDDDCRYALVIQDFYSGDPIDILRSRRDNVTEPYFASIPREERYAVKYLISDMYHPYVRYVNKYFPNAVSVVDSFSCSSVDQQIDT